MNLATHLTLPEYVLHHDMPPEFRGFLLEMPLAERQKMYDAPDLIDHSTGAGIYNYEHSHKFDEVTVGDARHLKWRKGDVIKKIEAEAKDAWEAYLEGYPDETRRHLCKVAHFCIDSKTLPHLVHGDRSDAMHIPFEHHIGGRIETILERCKPVEVTPFQDIYKETLHASEQVYWTQAPLLELYAGGGKVSQHPDFEDKVIHHCRLQLARLWITVWTLIERHESKEATR